MRRLKKVVGTVISSSMTKTAVVEVERVYVHSKYRRIVRMRKSYFAHDEYNVCGVGDKVQIWPVGHKLGRSDRKTWAVIDIVKRQPRIGGEPCEMSYLVRPGEVAPATHPVFVAAGEVLQERA
jgi:small subunit ribosomal protein S17